MTALEAFEKYSSHLYSCPKGHDDGACGEASARQNCTCGYTQALIDILGYERVPENDGTTHGLKDVVRKPN